VPARTAWSWAGKTSTRTARLAADFRKRGMQEAVTSDGASDGGRSTGPL
jgi:hypothetical protein